MARLSQFSPSWLGDVSEAPKLSRLEGTLTLDALNEDRTRLGTCPTVVEVQAVAIDDGIGKRSSKLQVPTANQETLLMSKPFPSLASLRTGSPELYIPPLDCKDEPPQDCCVTSFENDLQVPGPRSPVQKVEDSTRDKASRRRRPESSKRQRKRRKRSETEFAVADVDAAIGIIISAAEAVVVGHLMDASNLSPSLDRSTFLEAALSLRKARHLCGLDKYEFTATLKDSDEFAMRGLDFDSMQQAYADVGMLVGVPEEENRLLGVNAEEVNLCQANAEVHATSLHKRTGPSETGSPLQSNKESTVKVCKALAHKCASVHNISRNSEAQTRQTGAQESECGSKLANKQIVLETDKSVDNAQLHGFVTQQVNDSLDSCQGPVRELSTIGPDFINGGPLKVDGTLPQQEVKRPTQNCDSVAVACSDVENEVGGPVAGVDEFNFRGCLQDTEVLQGNDTAINEIKALGVHTVELEPCQQDSKVPAKLLSSINCPVDNCGSSFGDGEPDANCKSEQFVPYQRADKSEDTVAQTRKASLVLKDVLPDSEMGLADVLVQLGSIVGGICDNAKRQEGVLQLSGQGEAEGISAVEIGVAKVQGAQFMHTRDFPAEHCVPSEAMVCELISTLMN